MKEIKENGLIFVNAVWYNTLDGQFIGIVKCRTASNEEKKYIGIGSGIDEEQDIRRIMRFGTKFYDVI